MRVLVWSGAILLAWLVACQGDLADDDSGGDDDSGPGGPCEPAGEGGTVPIDGDCLLVQPYSEFDPEEIIEWQWSGSAVDAAYDQVMMTPIVINLTDDDGDLVVDDRDTPDVLFNTYAGSNYTTDGRLRAVSGADGSDLWTVTDPAYATAPGSGLAAGDLDGDLLPEIVAVTDDGELMLVEHDGSVTWVTAHGRSFGTGTHPAIADLLGDGTPEIIVGRLILDASGAIVAEGAYGSASMGWGPISFAADVDGDGVQEIVCDNAVYEPDGSALWADTSIPAGFPAIADFPQRPGPEVVLVAGGNVYLHDAVNGDLLWGPTYVDSAGRGGPPTVADYDGDGEPEIGVAGLGYYTAVDTDGSIMWTNVTEDDSSSMTGSSVFDFNGDGVAEVVYADEHALYVYEGPTGNILFTAEGHASGTLWENPVIVDIDHDYSAEIVVASNDMWWEGWNGITVLGAREASWYPARGIWNQHAYAITNIEDDGTIPVSPEPSWVTYNSFRRNTVFDESALWAADLYLRTVEACLDLCPQELVLLVEVANGGLVDVPSGVPVSVWMQTGPESEELLATEYLSVDLESGRYEPLAISLDPAALVGADVRISVDEVSGLEGGFHAECDEEDNDIVLPGLTCP